MKRQSRKKFTHSKPAQGTAVLGRVIPELAICGVFGLSDDDVSFIAKGITTALLAQFQMDLLEHSGLLTQRPEDD